MNWFDIANRNYQLNLYGKLEVAKFVDAKKITPEQYKLITGDEYK